MRYLIRVAMSFALLVCASSLAWSVTPAQDQKETGTITGRVTLDGKPAQGVIVMATVGGSDQARMVEQMLKPSGSPKTITDSDGRYRLEGVPAGTYYITPSAPALVSLAADKLENYVTVTGDAIIERIDFSLTRGGVISGKITDNEGRPVIAALVSLKPVGNSYSADFYSMSRDRMFFTDDRGIYRLFGLPAGRYLVSAGNSDNSPFGQVFTVPSRGRTYYPGVTDEPSAKPVEVAAGAEALGVDIKLGTTAKGFVVSGRIVDAETRKPAGITMVAYGIKARRDASDKDDDEDDDDERFGAIGGFTMTNARGEFRFESVAPGSYQTQTESMGELTGGTEYYADPVDFEVRSSNLDNLEISVHRGASISGVVVFENAESSELREHIATLILKANVSNAQTGSSSSGLGRVAADGSFRIGGLKAGKASISQGGRVETTSFGQQKSSILRIERNGVEQPDGIVLRPNEQITGVRVIVIKANCVIRGHVTLQGGSLPSKSVSFASARSTSAQSDDHQEFPVDAKGNFVIEGLAPGDYEVEIKCFATDVIEAKQLGSAKQNVTVVSGIPAEVNLVLDLTATKRDK